MMDNVEIFPFFQNSKMLFTRDINGRRSLSLSDGKYQYAIMCFWLHTLNIFFPFLE